MNRRERLRRAVEARIGNRRLVWFGTRGDDVESVVDLPQLEASFSVISTYRSRKKVRATSLEDVRKSRVDLDAYDIDNELSHDDVVELRQHLLRTLREPSVLFTYRPSVFLSAIHFARLDRCEYAGMFKDHQAAFEHKPWIETQVAALGLPTVPWTYIADEEQLNTLDRFGDQPLLLRQSHSSGGFGFAAVEHVGELQERWPHQQEAYVAVAPLLDETVPLNVGAVVWGDGVTVHPLSFQLIGIPGGTDRRFGYCGNDFAVCADLDRAMIELVEKRTVIVGEFLRKLGYRGAFGLDFLVNGHEVLFTEVNPRLQGSTHLSAEISTRLDEPCILLEHLAACLGMPSDRAAGLVDYARAAPSVAHVVAHNLTGEPATVDVDRLHRVTEERAWVKRVDVLPEPGVVIEPGATVARFTVEGPITKTGYEVEHHVAELLDDVRLCLQPLKGSPT